MIQTVSLKKADILPKDLILGGVSWEKDRHYKIMMDDREERNLIERASRGDARAFEDLVNRHYQTMFKMAYKWCGNRQDAEDITQDACIKLARNISSFRFESAFTSWLYVLTINTAKDWYRKNNRHNVSSGEIESIPTPGAQDDQLHAKEVLTEIRNLPEGEKEAVLLVFGEGLSHAEAAKLCGCKESTISWRIHEARKKLGGAFGEERSYG